MPSPYVATFGRSVISPAKCSMMEPWLQMTSGDGGRGYLAMLPLLWRCDGATFGGR